MYLLYDIPACIAELLILVSSRHMEVLPEISNIEAMARATESRALSIHDLSCHGGDTSDLQH